MAQSKTNSRALRFYSDVLGLEHLHYGIWQADDELTLANLKAAQVCYQQAIIDLIPQGSKTVLDVGCGTGELSLRLKNMGFAVEGVSPDINQRASYIEKVGRPFHHCQFEDFKAQQQYDVVIMSESCQYIQIDRLFANLTACLRPSGVWVVADYFVRDNAEGVMAQSGHNFTAFMAQAKQSRLVCKSDRDITQETGKTLDFAKDLVQRGELAARMLKERIAQRSKILNMVVNAILFLARKELVKLEARRPLINSQQFAATKTYRIMQWQLPE